MLLQRPMKSLGADSGSIRIFYQGLQALEILAVSLDEVAVQSAECRNLASKLENERRRARSAVLIAPRSGVAVQVDHPAARGVGADLAGKGHDVLAQISCLRTAAAFLLTKNWLPCSVSVSLAASPPRSSTRLSDSSAWVSSISS